MGSRPLGLATEFWRKEGGMLLDGIGEFPSIAEVISYQVLTSWVDFIDEP